MLYERWKQVANAFPKEIALHDLTTGESWTFAELVGITETSDEPDGPVVFPQGTSSAFIFSVLQAWRFGKRLCPLEPGMTAPVFPNFPADCVHFKISSASTGTARHIGFTAEQLAADADNIVHTMRLQRKACNLGVISLAHSYGFSNLVLPLLLHGIPLALAGSGLPETVRQAARRFDQITLPAVPALWRTWLQARTVPPNIALAISAGASLPLNLEKEIFEKCGVKIHNFYGASECGGVAYDSSSRPRQDPSFVGEPMHHVQVESDAEGHFVVRSAAVGQTYWPKADVALQPGCFRTSDLGEVRQGKVFLSGRSSDQINVAGRKIAPEFIETALLAHPEVSDCLVFGIPSHDTERGESIVACVSVNGRLTAELLKQFLLRNMPAWKVPREWWIVNSLDVNGRGKRSRAEWREKFLKTKADADTASWQKR